MGATSIVIAAHCLPELSMRCYHIGGRGGAKAAVRFIDDMRSENTFVFRTGCGRAVILAPTRWKLRAAIRLVNETLAELKVEQHPDKTFIGRISRGFDFLGYEFSPTGLEVAPRAVEHCVERVAQLYERGADLVRIGAYVRCWKRWARSGLGGLGADLAERALGRVERLVVCVDWPLWPLPPRLLAFAERGQRQADRTGDSCLHR